MATNQTTNYQLNQWEPTDAVQRVEFNQDNAKVDAALKALSDQVVQKANQSAVNTLISAVNQKVDPGDLAALSATVDQKANQSDLTSLSSTVQQIQADLTKITFGTYTGDNTATRVIDLGFTPDALLLLPGLSSVLYVYGEHDYYRGGLVYPGHSLSLTINSQNVTFLEIVDGGFQVVYQDVARIHFHTNSAGFQYFYIAFQQ